MDINIPALRPITRFPIDMSIVERSGEPGTPGRVAVVNALRLLADGPCWQHRGRGGESPPSYDWLGFVREVVQSTMRDCISDDIALDDFLIYGIGYERGPTVDQFRELAGRWGMREIAFADAAPGDLLVYGMPMAHAGIKLPDIETGTIYKPRQEPRMASTYWARPAGQQFIAGQWVECASTAFTWGAL